MLSAALIIVAAYLLGSIPFSVIVGYLFAGVDVRKHGSGNAGATNVYRVAGLPAAIIAGVLDVLKGALPVIAAKSLAPDLHWLPLVAGVAAVVGHIFPIFAGFRGGKGVNTLLGMFLILLPLEIALSFGVFAVVFAATRIVSLGSICAGVSLSLIVLIEKYIMAKNIPTLLLSACFGVTLLILFTHRANIRRLLRGQERKLSR
ncbi:MAG: glycerol-3-phosphate 1-O-acyltransferase PlsY [candidate division Zixibacteria bacterium]|nr:glycerol-3-phosphate 1-O-acyltransferase PlsY [candidate division Zixibacteria bacterium]